MQVSCISLLRVPALTVRHNGTNRRVETQGAFCSLRGLLDR